MPVANGWSGYWRHRLDCLWILSLLQSLIAEDFARGVLRLAEPVCIRTKRSPVKEGIVPRRVQLRRRGAALATSDIGVGERGCGCILPIVFSSFPPPPGFSVELFKKTHITPNVRPLRRVVVGDIGELLWILMGSIGMVLLIASANVAHLLLVRTERRQQELATRVALGARWTLIAADLLFESVLIGLPGRHCGSGVGVRRTALFLMWLVPAGLPLGGFPEFGPAQWAGVPPVRGRPRSFLRFTKRPRPLYLPVDVRGSLFVCVLH